jgi:hypothetical protein
MCCDQKHVGSAGAPPALFRASPKSLLVAQQGRERVARGAQRSERGARAPQSTTWLTNNAWINYVKKLGKKAP